MGGLWVIGEGNGNRLQYSCLENPMIRGAWWTTTSPRGQRVGHDWVASLSLSLYESLFGAQNFLGYIGKNSISLSIINPLSFGLWKKEMATHSSTLASRIPWTEEPGGLLSMGSHRLGHDWSDLACMHACIGEENGNTLQCSYLENPRDGGAWWAAVYGVTQSWTRLKQLSSSSNSIWLKMLC